MSFTDRFKNKLQEIKSEREELANSTEIGTIITDHEKRLEICHGCEFYFKITAQCKKCGCFLPAKTRLKSSRCPLKKW